MKYYLLPILAAACTFTQITTPTVAKEAIEGAWVGTFTDPKFDGARQLRIKTVNEDGSFLGFYFDRGSENTWIIHGILKDDRISFNEVGKDVKARWNFRRDQDGNFTGILNDRNEKKPIKFQLLSKDWKSPLGEEITCRYSANNSSGSAYHIAYLKEFLTTYQLGTYKSRICINGKLMDNID